MTIKTVPCTPKKTETFTGNAHRLGLHHYISNGLVESDGFMRASSTGRYGKMEYLTAPAYTL